jgi:hypothetical protein
VTYKIGDFLQKKKEKEKVEFTLEKPNTRKVKGGNSHFFGHKKDKSFWGKEKQNTIKIAYPPKFKYN